MLPRSPFLDNFLFADELTGTVILHSQIGFPPAWFWREMEGCSVTSTTLLSVCRNRSDEKRPDRVQAHKVQREPW